MATSQNTAGDVRLYDPATLPERYAAEGRGRCMEPVIQDGTCLVFDREGEANAGDIVGLWLRPEAVPAGQPQQMVKRLVMGLPPIRLPFRPGPGNECVPIIVVEQLNPPLTYRFRATDVIAVHRCIGSAEPAADGVARFRPSTAGDFSKRAAA